VYKSIDETVGSVSIVRWSETSRSDSKW